MIIKTNISSTGDSVHDSIKYTSIERQLFDMLSIRFDGVTYELEKKYTCFFVGDITICAEIKKSIKLTVTSMSKHWNEDFEIRDSGDHYAKWPSVNLKFNTDITKPLNKFLDKIIAFQDCKDRAKPIFDKLKNNRQEKLEKIEKFLNNHFGNNYTEVTFWYDENKFFDGLGIGLSIHPKGKAPADGAYMHLETDGTIDTFWNGSTERRTHGSNPETLEKIISRIDFGDGISGMKTKIEALESLEKKIREFDYTKCSELAEMIELKKQANKIKEKLSKI